MEIKIVALTSSKTDGELLAMPFEKARWLKTADMEKWMELHNRKGNFYHINNNNELQEVPPEGWWY